VYNVIHSLPRLNKKKKKKKIRIDTHEETIVSSDPGECEKKKKASLSGHGGMVKLPQSQILSSVIFVPWYA
jgi:hypothetical protein